MAWLDVSHLRIEWRQRPARSARSTTPRARAQHAASNLNNRDVEILCAASARVNVSVLYQPLTPPTDLGLLASPRAAGNPGRAARGSVASRKMACRPAGESHVRFKAINSRTGEGQPSRCPFLIGSGNGCQDAQPCLARRPVALLRRRRLDFGSPCFGFGLFCARCSRRSRHSLGAVTLTWTS